MSIIIAIIGFCGIGTGALVARYTAMKIAQLNAAQKRRDTELAASKEYADTAIKAAGALEALIWYADDSYLEHSDVTPEAWHGARDLLVPAREAVSKLDHLVMLVDDEKVKRLNAVFTDIARRILRAPDPDDGNVSPKDIWSDAVSKEDPDSIAALIAAAHELRARQLNTYPTRVPSMWSSWCAKHDQKRFGAGR